MGAEHDDLADVVRDGNRAQRSDATAGERHDQDVAVHLRKSVQALQGFEVLLPLLSLLAELGNALLVQLGARDPDGVQPLVLKKHEKVPGRGVLLAGGRPSHENGQQEPSLSRGWKSSLEDAVDHPHEFCEEEDVAEASQGEHHRR